MFILENIIRQEISKAFLMCEIKIDIDDLKKRGFATQIGQMYLDVFKSYNPISIKGKIGLTGDEYKNVINKLGLNSFTSPQHDGSYFILSFKNGDKLEVFRNTNPAYIYIFLNGGKLADIKDPNEIFRTNMAELVKQYYSDYILSKKTD